MKILKTLPVILLSAVAYSASANTMSTAMSQCVASEKRCTIEMTLPPGVVSWYITSQAAGNPGLTIRYSDGRGSWNDVVKTTVHSTDLSNKSFGDFVVDKKRKYEFIFTNIVDVANDAAAITNSNFETVTQTMQFAGEDGVDADFNDIYASVTWFKKRG